MATETAPTSQSIYTNLQTLLEGVGEGISDRSDQSALSKAITDYISNPAADPNQEMLKNQLASKSLQNNPGLYEKLDQNLLSQIVEQTQHAPSNWRNEVEQLDPESRLNINEPYKTMAAIKVQVKSTGRHIDDPRPDVSAENFVAFNSPESIVRSMTSQFGMQDVIGEHNGNLVVGSVPANGFQQGLSEEAKAAIASGDVVYIAYGSQWPGSSAALAQGLEGKGIHVLAHEGKDTSIRGGFSHEILISKEDFEKLAPELAKTPGQRDKMPFIPVLPETEAVPGKKAALDQEVTIAQAAPAPAVAAAPALVVTGAPSSFVPPSEQAPAFTVVASAQDVPVLPANPEIVPDAQAQRFASALDKAAEFIRGKAGEKGHYVTKNTDNAEVEQQIEKAAASIGVNITMDGNLTRKEIIDLQKELGFTKGNGLDAIIGVNTLGRLEARQATMNDIQVPANVPHNTDKGGHEIV